MAQSLRAGVATALITPAAGIRLTGFAARPGPSESVRDELEATALVLDDGTVRVAILACDLCFVHPTLLRRTRALVTQATGLPAEHLLVCCSHTHSGPITYVQPGGSEIERAYVEYLPYLLASAVATAGRRLEPARLRAGHGTATIGVQRRQPDDHGRVHMGEYDAGLVDPDVAVVCVEGPTGQPLATLVNYACHPVILGPDSLAASADFVGAMRQIVKEATGAPCLFVQGACADINPRGRDRAASPGLTTPSDTLVGTLGSALGTAVLAAREGALPVAATPVVARSRPLLLPLALSWSPPGGGDLRQQLSQLFRFGTDSPPLTPETVAAVMDERFPWAAELAQDGDGRASITVEVAVARCGDIAILGISGEPFVATGLAIKAGSALAHTLVAGYTNGCPGYLPPRYAYPEGGYEVDEAYLWYRLPAPPEPGGAERVSDEALGLLPG